LAIAVNNIDGIKTRDKITVDTLILQKLCRSLKMLSIQNVLKA